MSDCAFSLPDFLTSLSDDLRHAGKCGEAVDILHHYLRRVGFVRTVYGHMSAFDHWQEAGWAPRMELRGFPNGLERVGAYDPYYRSAVETRSVVNWYRIRREYQAVPDAEAFFEFTQSDLMYGLTVPVRTPGGGFSFISAVGPTEPEAWSRLEAWGQAFLPFIAPYFNSVASGLGDRRAQLGHLCLSNRELECLAWTACGKTAEDIGLLLSISSETVRIYLKRISKKLDATNRTHAVAKAMALGFDPVAYLNCSSVH